MTNRRRKLLKIEPLSETCRARLIEPRLHTAVSAEEVTSVISVHRFERCTTFSGLPV